MEKLKDNSLIVLRSSVSDFNSLRITITKFLIRVYGDDTRGKGRGTWVNEGGNGHLKTQMGNNIMIGEPKLGEGFFLNTSKNGKKGG